MARATRNAIGGYVYHCLNRANAQIKIFKTDKDYRLFEDILKEGVEKFNMQLLAYCIMPNHWHLVLYPQHDGDLSLFMGWITNTHTKRWHTLHNTIGTGHLYQGRYKSFLVQNDNHFLTLVRYVERNARKANLVQKAEEWRWGSAYLRKYGTEKQRKFLNIFFFFFIIHFAVIKLNRWHHNLSHASMTNKLPLFWRTNIDQNDLRVFFHHCSGFFSINIKTLRGMFFGV